MERGRVGLGRVDLNRFGDVMGVLGVCVLGVCVLGLCVLGVCVLNVRNVKFIVSLRGYLDVNGLYICVCVDVNGLYVGLSKFLETKVKHRVEWIILEVNFLGL